MRVFALSDVHVDYDANAGLLANLSSSDYQDDVLILAGDVSHARRRLDWCLGILARRFRKVLFVPGNHDLWVIREEREIDSLEKFHEVSALVESSGASMQVFRERGVSIVPLLAWYDYSFGEPGDELRSRWMDFRACRWPAGFTERDVAAYFALLNDEHRIAEGDLVITYSHFLPRADLVPKSASCGRRMLAPILGSIRVERQLRWLGSSIHVYGHLHVNRQITIDGTSYVNNAFGYPHETSTTAKQLKCIYEC
jgi:predicted phosphodiesterase